LENGSVAQRGTADEITRRPRTPYVAELVGVNLYLGRATREEIAIDGGGRLMALGGATGDVFATVHPRAVTLHRHEPEGSPRNVWQGVIGDIDREDDRARVRVFGAPPIVAEVTTAAVLDLELVPGDPVWVSVKATEVSVYPA
jgi:molybdate transport system ATP-binding protein